MKTATAFAVASLLALVLLQTAPAAAAAASCGLTPLKPLTPLGCSDLVAQCQCDSRGENCSWEWICVR